MDLKSICSTVLSCFPCCQYRKVNENVNQADNEVTGTLVFAGPDEIVNDSSEIKVDPTSAQELLDLCQSRLQEGQGIFDSYDDHKSNVLSIFKHPIRKALDSNSTEEDLLTPPLPRQVSFVRPVPSNDAKNESIIVESKVVGSREGENSPPSSPPPPPPPPRENSLLPANQLFVWPVPDNALDLPPPSLDLYGVERTARVLTEYQARRKPAQTPEVRVPVSKTLSPGGNLYSRSELDIADGIYKNGVNQSLYTTQVIGDKRISRVERTYGPDYKPSFYTTVVINPDTTDVENWYRNELGPIRGGQQISLKPSALITKGEINRNDSREMWMYIDK
jgi:hypothetical protein